MLTDRYSVRTINAVLKPGSPAERAYRARAATSPELRERLGRRALARGFSPTQDHDLLYFGGRIIVNMTVATFYLGGSRAIPAAERALIDGALASALSDPGLENVMAQYFGDGPSTTTFLPSTVSAARARKVYTAKGVRELARRYGAANRTDLADTLVLFLLPPGALLTDDGDPGDVQPSRGRPAAINPALREAEEASSLDGLGGYHGSVHLKDGRTVYYAVCVYSDTASLGSANGIPVWPEGWKNVVATAYHEINEARTDPDVEDAIAAGDSEEALRFIGWMSNQGEECGDFPVFEADPLTLAFVEVPVAGAVGSVPIQLQYSNAVHGPEGPIAAPHAR